MLTDLPLTPAPRPHRACCDCGERVSEFRWSPYFCPSCDLTRMERVDASMKRLAEAFGLLERGEPPCH